MTVTGFSHGMGIGGWLTNYKRFNVLPEEWRLVLSPGDYEHFDTYIGKSDVEYIASLGMDHIRLGFDQLVIEDGAGGFRERTIRLIDDFCDWCDSAGVNIVLNLHKAIGNYCDIREAVTLWDDEALQERFIRLWVNMEKRYHNRKNIAFELLNEVRGEIGPEPWNVLARKTVAAIRERNPERRLIVGSIFWNSADRLGLLPEFDENVIYTFHFYAPFEFTHQQGVLQPYPLYYNRKLPYPGPIEPYREYQQFVCKAEKAYENYARMDIAFLRDALRPAFEFAASRPGNTVWCGEFGTIRHIPVIYRENYMRDVISLLRENNIPYCVWNYLSTPNDGNRFSLVDDDTRKILSDELARIIAGRF